MSKIKAIGYVRVSSDEQALSGISLKAQRDKITKYAQLYDLELVEIIEDAGKSAKNMNRPGVQRVLKMAAKGSIEAVVIYKLDRIFRSVLDALTTAQTFDKQGVALHSICESLDTRSATGKFFFTLTAALAEMERGVISERTKLALQHKKAKGEQYGAVPYGFDSQDGLLVKNTQEQATLARLRELRKKGYSFQQTANVLNQEGHPTKQGKPWRWETVRSIYIRNTPTDE